jgi:hypothetical protein
LRKATEGRPTAGPVADSGVNLLIAGPDHNG